MEETRSDARHFGREGQQQRSADRLAFIATDIEIEIAAHLAVEATGDAKGITVGARKLLDILRALPEGSEVTLTLRDRRVQVKSGTQDLARTGCDPASLSNGP
jgi:DNA polymerase-3 subunit beta